MTKQEVNQRIKTIEKKLHFCAPQKTFERIFQKEGIIDDYLRHNLNKTRHVTSTIMHNRGYRTCSFLDEKGNLSRYYVHKSVVLSPEQIDEMALVNKSNAKSNVGVHNNLDRDSSKATGRSPKKLIIIEGQAI